MVAEEKVFAKRGAFAAVELRGNLDGGRLGVLVVVERYPHALQRLVYLWLSYHGAVVLGCKNTNKKPFEKKVVSLQP